MGVVPVRIAIIHATANAVQPLMDGFKKAAAKDAVVLNFVNEYMLERANTLGRVDGKALRIFTQLVFSAMEAEPDILVVACSVYFPYVPLLESFLSVPVIAVDTPMLEAAVGNGNKIGLIVTTLPTAAATEKRLLQLAGKNAKQIEIFIEAVPEAMKLLSAGDVKGHNAAVAEAGERLVGKGCDTIVLCQITTACAADGMRHLKAAVLNSIDTGVERVFQLIGCKDQKRI
jgi:aspartate/glutamate racemase